MRKERFETLGGLPIQAIPTHSDVDVSSELPGLAPFTRGVHETMYRSRYWTMRQYAGFSSAERTNERFHTLLARGQSGLSVAFDLPTQLGMDSEDPLSYGEVGRVGVAIDSILDIKAVSATKTL